MTCLHRHQHTTKSSIGILLLLIAMLICGCSGLTPSISKGRIVSAQEIARFRGGDSLSTLWYLGSDDEYHHFAHFVKLSTRYRVARSELQLPNEFAYKSKNPVHVDNSPKWNSFKRQRTDAAIGDPNCDQVL